VSSVFSDLTELHNLARLNPILFQILGKKFVVVILGTAVVCFRRKKIKKLKAKFLGWTSGKAFPFTSKFDVCKQKNVFFTSQTFTSFSLKRLSKV